MKLESLKIKKFEDDIINNESLNLCKGGDYSTTHRLDGNVYHDCVDTSTNKPASEGGNDVSVGPIVR